MDKLKCPICYTEVEERNFKETYVSPYSNQEYKRYECQNCDVHWWEPLKIIPEFYESEVFENYIAFHESVGTKLREYHKAFFKYFPSNVRGRLLDVGCGDGRFLRHAKEKGFEVWGIDFDKKSVETVKRNLTYNKKFVLLIKVLRIIKNFTLMTLSFPYTIKLLVQNKNGLNLYFQAKL